MTSNHETIEAKITRRTDEAEGIIALELQAANGAPLPGFDAGAHIDVEVAPGLIRQYSLANAPGETHRYLLGILRDPASRGGSEGIHQNFTEGRVVKIGAPRNNFPLLETAQKTILLAGGIGVTPMMAMAQRLAAIGADFEFHYCARSRSRAGFLDFLAQSSFADRVHLHFDDEAEAQKFDLAGTLGKPEPGKHVYICGPTGFIDFTKNGALAAGWASANVHVEYFGATVEISGDVFTVVAKKSGITCVVPADKSISSVLIEHGVDVPISCEQGVCGACLTNVLEGTPDNRDFYLTDEEKAEGKQMTICCSRSKTPALVLDI